MQHEAAFRFGHTVDADPVDDGAQGDDAGRAKTVSEGAGHRHACPPKKVLDGKRQREGFAAPALIQGHWLEEQSEHRP